MKKVSGVRTIGEGGDELKQAESELAEVLRDANTGGLTTEMGLRQRLDYGAFSRIENMRTLVRIVLDDWGAKNDPTWNDQEKENTAEELQGEGIDTKAAERILTARKLRKAIKLFEECLKRKENAA